MRLRLDDDRVYDSTRLPEYSWQTYQRGFLGILNNAYNQSCNCGTKRLGDMSEIETAFTDADGGSWPDFVAFYFDTYDGRRRVHECVDCMTDNLQQRVESIGGSVDRDKAEYWSRTYIWSMLANTYTGFCSERAAIQTVADIFDVPYTLSGDETEGVDGYIGSCSVQVKPRSHSGLDVNGYEADYCIRYWHDDETSEFVFDVPDGIVPKDF